MEISEELPDLMVIHGDGRSSELLEEESIESMDAFYRLPNQKLILCLVLWQVPGVEKTVHLLRIWTISIFKL